MSDPLGCLGHGPGQFDKPSHTGNTMPSGSRFPYSRFTQNRSLDEAERLFHQRVADALDIYVRHHESFVARACPVCGSSRHRALDRFHGTYGVARCEMCGSVFVNPAPSLEALKDYYNNSECNLMLDRIYRKRAHQPNDFIGDSRVATVIGYLSERTAGPISILEIGCGSGSFLSKLRRGVHAQFPSGPEVQLFGIDIDGNAIAQNDDLHISLVHSAVEEFARTNPDSYDYVLCFELIEHLIDPFGFIQDVRSLLKVNGTLILTTPNSGGLEMIGSDYNSYRLLAHSIFPPMHLNAFSTTNITHFALRSQLAALDIQTPGALDVDMVSVTKDKIDDDALRALADVDDEMKGLVQRLVVKCRVSSHMQCVLRRI